MRSEIERKLAKKLKLEGNTFSQISTILGISKDSVRNLYRYGIKLNKKSTRPKPKVNSKMKYSIRREIALLRKYGKKVNTTKIINNCNLNISKTTCWRELNKSGLKYRRVNQ